MASGEETATIFTTYDDIDNMENSTTAIINKSQQAQINNNNLLLFIIISICSAILLLVFILSICVCVHCSSKKRGQDKVKELNTNERQTKATSTTGLDQINEENKVEDFKNKDGGGGGDNNESSTLLSAQIDGSLWTESPGMMDSYSNLSSTNQLNYNHLDLLSLNTDPRSKQINGDLSSSASTNEVVEFPTDDNGHPRAWFVPLNEMCQESVRHSGIVVPSSNHHLTYGGGADTINIPQSTTAIKSRGSMMKKSESSHAKLQSFPSAASNGKLSKWAQREGRPVVFVSTTSSANNNHATTVI